MISETKLVLIAVMLVRAVVLQLLSINGSSSSSMTTTTTLYACCYHVTCSKQDECHSRIKFNHRGQVAMANENAPNTNSSQFFFTLDRAEWLDKKHTIFGKITGNTIFNALRMGDIDTDGEVSVTLVYETLERTVIAIE
jgi:cyclophilin family peptidyl-prolyl cis-trans isomerase